MRVLTHRSAALVLAISLCIPSTALGQGASPGTEDSPAARLFQDGRDAMKRGDYAGACSKFEESERLVAAPGTLLNLAACREKLGKVAGALKALEEARAALPAGDSRLDYISEHTASLKGRVPALTVRVSPAPPAGTIVTLNGEEISRAALASPILVDPGTHIIVLSAPGHEDATRTVSIAEGTAETVALTLGSPREAQEAHEPREPQAAAIAPSEPPHGTRPEEGASHGSAQRTAGYVALGVGGVGLIVGTVGGILVLNKKSEMHANCDDDLACNPQGMDAASAGKTFSTISTVGFVAGILGAGVGAYLLLTDDSTPGPSIALGVAPTANGGVLAAKGRF